VRCFGRVERAARQEDRGEHDDLCGAPRHARSLIGGVLAAPESALLTRRQIGSIVSTSNTASGSVTLEVR